MNNQLREVFDYIDKNQETYLEELGELIAQPSISTTGEGFEEFCDLLMSKLRKYGLNNIQKFSSEGPPYIYADIIEDQSYPTILVYGHYDVQPVDPVDAWDTPPFKMTLKNGRLYGRGTSDNKGQWYAAIMGMVAYRKIRGALPVNIKYLFEGEEEICSIHLPKFASDHKELLKADACIYSDGCYHENGYPELILGLKGAILFEITLKGANRETHSMRASCIPNVAWRMSELLTTLKGEDGFVKIDGFYDNVRPLKQIELDTCAKIPVDEKAICENYGISHLVKHSAGGTYYYNLMFEPHVNINGLFSGYTGKGYKGIIPNSATVRIDMHLVPNQTTGEIAEKLRKHLDSHGFADAEIKEIGGRYEPSRTPIDSPYVLACAQAVKDGFGEEPILFPGVGGAGPNCVFTDILGMPAIEIPFADALQNNHAPNESQVLSGFMNGIKTSAAVIERIPTVSRERGGEKK